jgi:hypothetical protein
LLPAQLVTPGGQAMTLWYVSRDGKRQLCADPRTGVSELTQKLGQEIGAKLIQQPDIQQVELADEIGAVHWWRRKGRPGQRGYGL